MNRSYTLAISLFGLIGLWMLSGLLTNANSETPAPVAVNDTRQPQRMKVQVTTLEAETVQQKMVIQGTLEPQREVEIKSLLNTTVADIVVDKGRFVEQGQPLVKLSIDNRAALVKQAQANVTKFTLELEAARKLEGQGLNSQTLVRRAEADLASAQAALEGAQIMLAHTNITAPFSGVWEDRFVETGSHVDVGKPIGRLVDNTALKAVGFISQQTVNTLRVGQTASVELLDGRTATGTLAYIANVGEAHTQSFRIEVLIPNETAQLPAGTSVAIRVETGRQQAHFVSPSVFALGQSGEVGVKGVSVDDTVEFYPVTMFRKESDGVWVTGLPATVTLITLGQGFVNVGEKVDAVHTNALTES